MKVTMMTGNARARTSSRLPIPVEVIVAVTAAKAEKKSLLLKAPSSALLAQKSVYSSLQKVL